jgi:hypothetical protein
MLRAITAKDHRINRCATGWRAARDSTLGNAFFKDGLGRPRHRQLRARASPAAARSRRAANFAYALEGAQVPDDAPLLEATRVPVRRPCDRQ